MTLLRSTQTGFPLWVIPECICEVSWPPISKLNHGRVFRDKFHYVFVMMGVGSLLTDTLVLSHAGYVMVYLILCYVFRLSVSASLLWYSMNVIGFDRQCPYYIYVEKLGTPDHPLSISTEVLSVFLKIYSTEKQNVKLTHHLILPLDITMGRWGYLRFDGRL